MLTSWVAGAWDIISRTSVIAVFKVTDLGHVHMTVFQTHFMAVFGWLSIYLSPEEFCWAWEVGSRKQP